MNTNDNVITGKSSFDLINNILFNNKRTIDNKIDIKNENRVNIQSIKLPNNSILKAKYDGFLLESLRSVKYEAVKKELKEKIYYTNLISSDEELLQLIKALYTLADEIKERNGEAKEKIDQCVKEVVCEMKEQLDTVYKLIFLKKEVIRRNGNIETFYNNIDMFYGTSMAESIKGINGLPDGVKIVLEPCNSDTYITRAVNYKHHSIEDNADFDKERLLLFLKELNGLFVVVFPPPELNTIDGTYNRIHLTEAISQRFNDTVLPYLQMIEREGFDWKRNKRIMKEVHNWLVGLYDCLEEGQPRNSLQHHINCFMAEHYSYTAQLDKMIKPTINFSANLKPSMNDKVVNFPKVDTILTFPLTHHVYIKVSGLIEFLRWACPINEGLNGTIVNQPTCHNTIMTLIKQTTFCLTLIIDSPIKTELKLEIAEHTLRWLDKKVDSIYLRTFAPRLLMSDINSDYRPTFNDRTCGMIKQMNNLFNDKYILNTFANDMAASSAYYNQLDVVGKGELYKFVIRRVSEEAIKMINLGKDNYMKRPQLYALGEEYKAKFGMPTKPSVILLGDVYRHDEDGRIFNNIKSQFKQTIELSSGTSVSYITNPIDSNKRQRSR